MASWIKSHTVLIRHRKLVDLSTGLRLKPVYVLGHLHVLWHNALEQQEDGDLTSWKDDSIASLSCYQGDAPQYVSLLREHGWLDGGLLHDWLDYAGRYLESKYRTSDPERLLNIFAKHGRHYEISDRRSLGRLKSDCSPSLDGPDKIREDKIRTKKKPVGSFDVLWKTYPNQGRVGRKDAFRHFNTSVKTPEDYALITLALKNYCGSEKVRKGFVQNGSTWFNNWRDWVDIKPEMEAKRGFIPQVLE